MGDDHDQNAGQATNSSRQWLHELWPDLPDRFAATVRSRVGWRSAAAVAALICIACVGWDLRHVLANYRADTEQAAFWDIVIKLTAGVGGWLAVIKYFDDKAAARQAAIDAARQPFLRRREEAYFALVDATGRISNIIENSLEEKVARNAAMADFWRLYWSIAAVVIDEHVAKALDQFSDALVTPDDYVPLRNASLALGKACRKSLGFDTQR